MPGETEPTRSRQVEHEFIQRISGDVGVRKQDITAYAEIRGEMVKVTYVKINVNDRGMEANSTISYRTNNRIAKRQALQRASDEIFNKLSIQERPLGTPASKGEAGDVAAA